jgi:hypothetical protein
MNKRLRIAIDKGKYLTGKLKWINTELPQIKIVSPVKAQMIHFGIKR